MADVELVIKIDEETYRNIQSYDWKNGEWWYSEEWRAIHNGTPLEKHDEEVIAETVESIWGKPPYRDMLDKIRTEIEAYQSDAFYPDDVMMNRRIVLEIIDKYRRQEDGKEKS